jgi:hypothetical protein
MRVSPRSFVLAVATAAGAAGLAAVQVQADFRRPEWDHDWVAVTVAQNGAWGLSVQSNVTRAMVGAIQDCRLKSREAGNDCGAEITTVRAAWSIAYACGDYAFIANGDTAADARVAAIDRAVDLRQILGFELEPCRLLVAVSEEGKILPSGDGREILHVPRGSPR